MHKVGFVPPVHQDDADDEEGECDGAEVGGGNAVGKHLAVIRTLDFLRTAGLERINSTMFDDVV